MTKSNYHHYTAWVSNDQGATETVGNSFTPPTFTSQRAAEQACRANYGPGWTAHIMGVWIDGDGHSWAADPAKGETEVKTFTIR